jgi:crotonobetainyl-CoA:carnitine CoA-transferase CaiB-like acyl-CoA transferase
MAAGALSHLRLIELGSGFASAYTAKLLADLGADVVKIEPPAGDATRKLGPFPGGKADPETSGMFLYLNANKRGIVLDLDSAADRSRFNKLVDRADVLIHDVAPAELARHGLEPHEVMRGRPKLVATSISPFGLSGPHRDYQAYDLNLWNAGGIACLNGGGPGTADLPPLRTFGYQSTRSAQSSPERPLESGSTSRCRRRKRW